MKAYRIEGQSSQTIYYVGLRKDVEQTLRNFFITHQQGVKPSNSFDLNRQQVHRERPIFDQPFDRTQASDYRDPPTHPSQSLSSNFSCHQPHVSLHILLFDLPLIEYNRIQSENLQRFKKQMRNFPSPISMHFAMVQNREESLRYIRKMEKYLTPEFEQNVFALNKELEQTTEYDLIKAYLTERFQINREEVFQFMSETGIKTLKELFVFQRMPNFRKRQIQKVVQNLTLLEQLYENAT